MAKITLYSHLGTRKTAAKKAAKKTARKNPRKTAAKSGGYDTAKIRGHHGYEIVVNGRVIAKFYSPAAAKEYGRAYVKAHNVQVGIKNLGAK